MEVQKVAIENVIGVRIGSMASRERSSKDVDCVIRGGIMLWRTVGMTSDGGHEYEGSIRRLWRKLRFGVDVDVTINLWKA